VASDESESWSWKCCSPVVDGNASALLCFSSPLHSSPLLSSAQLNSTQLSQLPQMGGVSTAAPACILGTTQNKGFLTLNDHSWARDQYCRASWGWAGESSILLSIRVRYRLSIVDYRLSIVDPVAWSWWRFHSPVTRQFREIREEEQIQHVQTVSF
jgi:hypothetical protein